MSCDSTIYLYERIGVSTCDLHTRIIKRRLSNGIKKDHVVLFTNPSARAGYDTRSVFKRSLTGFEFRVFLLLD